MDKDKFEFEPDRPLVPALVTRSKYWSDPILCQPGFNFDGAAALFTVPGISHAYFTYPLAKFSVRNASLRYNLITSYMNKKKFSRKGRFYLSVLSLV